MHLFFNCSIIYNLNYKICCKGLRWLERMGSNHRSGGVRDRCLTAWRLSNIETKHEVLKMFLVLRCFHKIIIAEGAYFNKTEINFSFKITIILYFSFNKIDCWKLSFYFLYILYHKIFKKSNYEFYPEIIKYICFWPSLVFTAFTSAFCADSVFKAQVVFRNTSALLGRLLITFFNSPTFNEFSLLLKIFYIYYIIFFKRSQRRGKGGVPAL